MDNLKDWEIELNWTDELFLTIAMTLFGDKDVFDTSQHKENLEDKIGMYVFGKRWEDIN